MAQSIDELIDRIKELQDELEVALKLKREEFKFIIEKKRVHFAAEVARQQRRLKIGLLRYVVRARPLHVLTAPVIYAGIVPFVLLDLFLWLYQAICFPVYRIPKAKRADYLVFDRVDLPYLNLLEKLNCLYCSYGNGIAAYAREVAARTEQYWCPIKHARRITAAHDRYPRFFEYGDAESFRKGLERLRKSYKDDRVGQDGRDGAASE